MLTNPLVPPETFSRQIGNLPAPVRTTDFVAGRLTKPEPAVVGLKISDGPQQQRFAGSGNPVQAKHLPRLYRQSVGATPKKT